MSLSYHRIFFIALALVARFAATFIPIVLRQMLDFCMLEAKKEAPLCLPGYETPYCFTIS